jgi:hypothetical protein
MAQNYLKLYTRLARSRTPATPLHGWNVAGGGS